MVFAVLINGAAAFHDPQGQQPQIHESQITGGSFPVALRFRYPALASLSLLLYLLQDH